ncbi:MAG TPA: SUMF1/EgtB/PvdO family nonheme iron enzyme, partial [Fibrobacteraceae bacterium]|nr:SUMF1/EgtB/PvdO family nonheme iron enzyme [Fibrobacteraceae bacterium]
MGSQKFSWNADNSDFKSHPVCTAGIDSASFCDLAGNLREWVNDWAGQLQDTTVTNYLGAFDGSDIGERILKGGYFSDRPSEMNMVARGDEYTVEAQIRADRIGLRLAFGAIPNPIWLDASGKVQENVVTVLASASTLKSFTGSYNTKLVFRNGVSENLAFVDYNDGTLSVIEIEDTLNVYHPDISPNGKHVA